MGVKANNGLRIADKLRFHFLVLNSCGGTEIWQYGGGRKRPVWCAKDAVCSSGKLARPRTRPITLMDTRWYRIRRRILAVFWHICLGRIGNVMRFLVVFRELGATI